MKGSAEQDMEKLRQRNLKILALNMLEWKKLQRKAEAHVGL